MFQNSFLYVLLWTFFCTANCKKVLGIFPLPYASHYIIGNKILVDLAKRGHEVTMVSVLSQKQPVENYREILLDGLYDSVRTTMKNRQAVLLNELTFTKIRRASQQISINTEDTLRHEKFQNLLNSNKTFDLILMEIFMNEALLGLSEIYKCPVILISPLGTPGHLSHIVGNPAPFAYVPITFSNYGVPKTMLGRMYNVVDGISQIIANYIFHYPHQTHLMQKYLRSNRTVDEIMYSKIALVFLYSHPAVSGVFPSVPALVNIGGYHLSKPKSLPEKLLEFLDSAEHGVVLFSLGSILECSKLPVHIFISAFAKLKQKVLWKCDNPHVGIDLPNVKAMKWLPQNDVLAHPNVKVFLTHGGIFSLTEAVYNAVPIIGIPLFGDQFINIQTAVDNGYGLQINFNKLSEDLLLDAINEILNNHVYEENIKRRSKFLRKQLPTASEKVIYWSEYVLNQKNTNILRSPALNLHWTELYLIDVIYTTVFLAVFIYLILTCSLRLAYSKSYQKLTKKK